MIRSILPTILALTLIGALACDRADIFSRDDNPQSQSESPSATVPAPTETSDATSEAVPRPTIAMTDVAGGASRENFAKCLNDVAQEIALLPWDYDVKDEETGETWDLDDYLSGNHEQIHTFRVLRCHQFAPVATSREGINRCVLDQVGWLREEYPGGAVHESAVLFALSICIPPYEP